MASNINSSNIDQTFPVAGQDNDSQGFRTNFTNIATGLSTASTEITDLQSKVVLKSALTGTSLSNAGSGALMSDFEFRDISETRVAKGTVSGTVTCSYAEGSYQTLTTSGSVTLAFSNFPASGKLGKIRIEITIANVAHTLTLPSAVTIGLTTLQGQLSNVITFDATGTYIFEFSTDDAGTTIAVNDLSRSRTKIDVRTATATGQVGDVAGMIAGDGTNLYLCTGSYDGSTVIWKKLVLQAI
jgi:hypothetical protein